MRVYGEKFKAQVINTVLNEGMPIKQAARDFNLSRNTVRHWTRSASQDKESLQNISRTSNTIKKEIAKKYLAGEPAIKIAKEYGVAYNSVTLWAAHYENETLKREIEVLKEKIKYFEEAGT